MLILNFSHPLTDEQADQVETLTGKEILEIREASVQFDHDISFRDQVRILLDEVGLTSTEYQTQPILINPPSYNYAALTLIAELHGRMGYFPAVIRMRPVQASLPQRYEVAEIINLQSVRDSARKWRKGANDA